MANILNGAPPIVYYTAISTALLAIVVARALDTYHNFYAAAFALSQSNGSILVMSNMALLNLYLLGRALQFIFFGPLRAMEIERLYQRGGFFVTDFMLAFATFREAFGFSSGVMVAILLFAKCFHWLLSDRIEAIDQLPYPGPKRLEHARLLALFFVLWVFDSLMFTYTLDAVMQKGIGLGVLFTTEYAILLVGLTQCIMKYVLTMIDIRRAASIGGATAPPWEQKPIYGFYIELSTAFIELAIYLTYFTLMSIYHSIPVYAIRDVYVSGSLFFSRSLAFIRYKRAMQALHAFPTPTQKELDSKSDNTCIVCREELVAPSIGSAASPAPNQNEQVGEPATQPSGSAPSNEPDSSNGPPKRLPCGHIFHLNCLRSWFERQLTCPTCRRKVDETLPRAPGPAGAAGGQPGAPGNNGARDAGRPGADVGGANPGAVRRPGNNPGTGAAPTDTPTQMKEPLKFEGFYLQANCFVPWAGGPVLPRDPTQPFPPQRQPAQLQRHRQYPGPPSASPTPTVQSPSQPTQPLAPFGAGLANAATTASIPEPVDLKNSDEEDTSSDDSTTQLIGSIQERRRIAAEAALKRHQAGRSSTPSTPTPTQKAAAGPSNLGTPLSSSELNQLMERNLNKYFTSMPDHNGRDGSPTPRTPIPFGAQSRSSAGISGQYNVRSDAPSFIPLFHNFHLLQQGPTIAPVKAWPLQGASQSQDGSTQTLTLPSSNSLLQFVPQTATSPTPGSGSRATFGRPSTPSPLGMQQFLQQQAGTSNLSHTRYTPSPLHREARREESPAQETERLDILTRLQVQERLKILENVKRLTQHCIDELLLVRGGQLTTSELSRVGRNMEGRSSESSQASDSSIRVRAEPTLLVVPAPSSISGAASVPPVATPLLQPVASVEAVGDPTGLILATSPGHKDPSSILSNPDVISLSSAISSPVPTPPAESSPVLVTEMEATSSEETKANPLVTAQSSISEEIEKEQNSPVL